MKITNLCIKKKKKSMKKSSFFLKSNKIDKTRVD